MTRIAGLQLRRSLTWARFRPHLPLPWVNRHFPREALARQPRWRTRPSRPQSSV